MGFTAIDNEFFELIPILSGNELKILLTVIRQTYGWHKESASLKLSDISKATGITIKNLSAPINTLIKKGYMRKNWSKEGLRYRFCIIVENKELVGCYEKYTSENCPFIKTKKMEKFCLQCPRYIIKTTT